MPITVKNSEGIITPFAASRTIGDMVISGLDKETAIARANMLQMVLESSGLQTISTDAIRYILGELGSNLDGRAFERIREYLRSQRKIVEGPVISTGAPSGGIEFVTQLNVSDPGQPFRLELPGSVIHVGASFLLDFLPVARLVIQGEGEISKRTALLKFAERSPAETDAALSSLQEPVRSTALQDFRILIEAEGLSFRDIIAAAGAKKYGRQSPADVSMRVQLTLAGKVPVTSRSYVGKMVVSSDDASSDDASCHEKHRWNDNTGKSTLCQGPCTPDDPGHGCSCGDPPMSSGKGWVFCWCQ